MSINFDLLAIMIVALPLLAAAFIGLSTRATCAIIAQSVTTASVFLSAVLSYIIFYKVYDSGSVIHLKLFTWFDIEDFKADWSIYIDMLTAVMLVVVTTVSVLVHVYSIGYMSDDPHQPRFMAYLSLFTFCMLMLVVSDNLIQLFFGWEGVGLSSYLLIGFWFKKREANAAAIKAFLINRVGDIGLALGIFLIFSKFYTFDYQSVFAEVKPLVGDVTHFFGMECDTITLICILLFIGCMGKSAQLGLHTWLPDAMEGPTPVSALIHAATMVTAGVFLLARCSPIFEYSETALNVVVFVGGITCIFAATVALVQDDIKKIIAYSTCSQLGYMFFACGVSAYSAGIFHLFTHAFFKALLFLGAGSVIHALSGAQDIKKMGGIWKKIPVTYAFMWIGSLALAGIPPFAGFYSKDAILEAAYISDNHFGGFAYLLGIAAAALTALYSWRLIILVFHGKSKLSTNQFAKVHESGPYMLIPLIFLSVGALLAGAIGVYCFDILNPEMIFWGKSIFVLPQNNVLHKIHSIEGMALYYPILLAILGILLAYALYIAAKGFLTFIYNHTKIIHNFLLNKWYFDELYNLLFVKSSFLIANFISLVVEVLAIDAIPNSAARLSRMFAKCVSSIQTGYLYHYAVAMILGVVVVIYLYLPW
ncbi:MAG: NADH-quinone oxidoreductase subunit L [Candidatus Lariskella arthropodorum]